MTLACLFPWVSKRNRSPSTLHIHVLSSENWNGQLVETQDGSKIRFFSWWWDNPEKDLFYFDSIINKWLWYKSTGQINYPRNVCSTGLSRWMGLCKTAKMKKTWRVKKKNAPQIFSKNKINRSRQLSLRTPQFHPPVFFSLFYSLDMLQGLFYPAYNSHFNSRI